MLKFQVLSELSLSVMMIRCVIMMLSRWRAQSALSRNDTANCQSTRCTHCITLMTSLTAPLAAVDAVVDDCDSLPQTREDRSQRHWLDPLLLTTAPHLAALAFVLPCIRFGNDTLLPVAGLRIGYAAVIIVSTMLSLSWHRRRESKAGRLFWLDYSFAAVWAAFDILLAAYTSPAALGLVVSLNALSFAANKACDCMAAAAAPATASDVALFKHLQPRLGSYVLLHSAWHVLNVCKSIAVAYIVGCTSTWCAG